MKLCVSALVLLILRLPSTPSSCATMSFIPLLHPTLSSSKEPLPLSRPVSPDDTGNPGVESAPIFQTNFEAFTRFKTQHVTDTLLYQSALDIQSDSPWAPWLISSVKAVSFSFLPLHARSPSYFFFPVPSRPHRQCHRPPSPPNSDGPLPLTATAHLVGHLAPF